MSKISRLQDTGIFKARLMSWNLTKGKEGGLSVGINCRFQVLAKLEGKSWADWENTYAPVEVFGTWWVIGKAGSPNKTSIDQIVGSLGWDGDIGAVAAGAMPDTRTCQIKVVSESPDGQKVYYKATWMNPESFSGALKGLPPDEAKGIQARFGGMLKAQAMKSAGTRPGVPGKPQKAPSSLAPTTPEEAGRAEPPIEPSGPVFPESTGDDPFPREDIPF